MSGASEPTLRHLPFRRLGVADVHLRYLEEDRDLEPFLGVRPRNAQDLLRLAPDGAKRLVAPEELADVLLAYAERHDAPQASREAARQIRSGDALVVVTGQQPGLLGGPLYTIHKAATAVRLARELSAITDKPVYPLFWNHTDDHDLDEVNGTWLVNGNQDLQRVRLDLDHNGMAIRHVPIGHIAEQALAAAGDLLPQSEFREWALAPFQPKHPDETFGDQLARLLFHLFGSFGMLVLEPRDLPPSAFDVLGRWRGRLEEIRNSVRTSTEHLGDLGLDMTMDPGATLMFQFQAGRRVALADEDPVGDVKDLSPGAILRPLWQDACLPSVAFVVGPGELSYLSVVGPLYRQLGVPSPVLVPRASLTLVEPSQKKQLKRFGLDIPDLAAGIETLSERIREDDDQNAAERQIDLVGETLRDGLTEVIGILDQGDKQMVGPAERTRAKMLDELRKLGQKVRNSRQNREGTGARQIRRLCNNLRPRSRLQERILPPVPYMVAHGEDLAGWLVDAADPFGIDHGVLEL